MFLKKFIVYLCIIFTLLGNFSHVSTVNAQNYITSHSNYNYDSPAKSQEELYGDIFISLLYTSIAETIKNYYHEYLLFNLSTIKIIDIQIYNLNNKVNSIDLTKEGSD